MTRRMALLLVIPILLAAIGSASAGGLFERNGLAIDGYDPVAYFTDQKPVKGSAEFQFSYQGSVFHFASADHRDLFAVSPAQYAPQYGGYCAYGMAKGYKAAIDPDAFTVVRDKLYLNYSEAIRTRWLSDIPGYVQRADANWPEVQRQAKVQE
jgi:YHS domain-containing protein